MSRSNIWLSIDWDYFMLEQAQWKWAHSESATFYSLIWEVRLALALSRGIDLKNEIALSHAAPTPASFWTTLERMGYDFTNVKAVYVGDSHRHANDVFRRSHMAGPSLSCTRLVNFDAHHDLTYNIKSFEKEALTNTVTCENWLLMTHLSQIGLQSLIVYPEWKGMRDWESTFGATPEVDASLRRYTEPCVWPSPKVAEAAGEVELVYICRSSAWSPPWHDQAFKQFVRTLHERTGVIVSAPFEEHLDPLNQRRIDYDHVHQLSKLDGIAQLAYQMENLSERSRAKVHKKALELVVEGS